MTTVNEIEAMDRSPSPAPAKKGTRRLNGIVNTYIRKRLPVEQHGSFKAIRALHDDDELAGREPTIASKEITAPLSNELVLAVPEIVEVLAPDTADAESSAKKHWLSDEVYRDVENEKIRLQQAIRDYEKKTAGSSLKAGIDFKTLTTWSDVCNEVDSAHERYKDAKGVFARIRKGFSKLGKHQDAVNTWLQLLPSSGDYLSVLCGGLKLVVSAAGRLREMDDSTVGALTEIPSLLLNTEEAVGVFEASNRLRACAADLYVSVLACINRMVVYFSQKAHKQLFRVAFKVDSYEEQMLESITIMQQHSDRFAKAAQACHYKTSMNTNDEVRAIHPKMDVTLEKLKKMDAKLEKMDLVQVKFMEEILAGLLSSNELVDAITRDLRPPLQSIRKAASSEDMIMLKERARARKALLDALDTEDSTTTDDISVNLRIAWSSSKDTQDRIMALMHNPNLHGWITTPHSTALFVNGNCPASVQRSPVSYISAKLTSSVRSQAQKKDPTALGEVITLSFFCNEHKHRKDPDRGPDGMMRNLIAQLLFAYDSFELLTVRKIKAFDYEDIDDLCDIFEMLVAQLPTSTMVFCIIDSVGIFEEDKSQRKDARTVMETLVDFADEEGDTCTFKLLVTSSWNSNALCKVFEDQAKDVLWMPRKLAPQGALTMSKLEAGIGQNALLSPAGY